jgi:hypothetical protein
MKQVLQRLVRISYFISNKEEWMQRRQLQLFFGGFCREVFKELPLEFAAEVNQLMSLKLEGSVG